MWLLVKPAVTNDGVVAAERGRFELPLPLRADRFSKPAHSTTLPPLRGVRRVARPPAVVKRLVTRGRAPGTSGSLSRRGPKGHPPRVNLVLQCRGMAERCRPAAPAVGLG